MVTVEKVQVLGAPAGNLWDVRLDGMRIARVTYHGDKLFVITGKLQPVTVTEVERLIEDLYCPKET